RLPTKSSRLWVTELPPQQAQRPRDDGQRPARKSAIGTDSIPLRCARGWYHRPFRGRLGSAKENYCVWGNALQNQ
ncbi:MAG TPA: hypothetical protein VK603_06100, partial [Candidatus Saccharimonadales bacterium]|nr:hypothetical protein [Candidatus Saccharimonadales bacterium]